MNNKLLDSTLILERIAELRNEYFTTFKEWEKEKTFKRFDRLKEIKQVFNELKIKL